MRTNFNVKNFTQFIIINSLFGICTRTPASLTFSVSACLPCGRAFSTSVWFCKQYFIAETQVQTRNSRQHESKYIMCIHAHDVLAILSWSWLCVIEHIFVLFGAFEKWQKMIYYMFYKMSCVFYRNGMSNAKKSKRKELKKPVNRISREHPSFEWRWKFFALLGRKTTEVTWHIDTIQKAEKKTPNNKCFYYFAFVACVFFLSFSLTRRAHVLSMHMELFCK